jgi:two-component system cell cycle response regulator
MSMSTLRPRPGPAPFLRVSRRVWQGAVIAGLAVFALHTGLGVGGPGADTLVDTWLYFVLEGLAILAVAARAVLVPDERVAWAWLAAGLLAYSLGDLAWTIHPYESAPTIADALYLFFYPAAYIALLLLVRSRVSRFNRSVWLDGVSVALAVGAVGAAFLLELALDHSEGDSLAIATNLAYPLGDVVLLALVVCVFWVVGRDAGREWVVIAGAFVATAVADAIYLWTITTGTYVEGSLLDILWPLMGILLAVAAWVRPGRARRIALEGRPLVATPILCTIMALTVFVVDHFWHINALAVMLAAATVGVVLTRTVTTLRENSLITERIQLLSVTDPLTHLWNRRKLVVDLERVLDAGAAEPHVLALYDLNGFKRFNDLFGHPAGDALLERLAANLVAAVSSSGTCYRLGGDEFCVLASLSSGGLDAFLDDTSVALSEAGDGFNVTTSFGCVFLPEETTNPGEAMQIADQRLYARKHHTLIERGQPHGVLLQALYEREPDLRDHVGRVAALSLELGRELELSDEALSEVELAAQLHDIGKLAIPDSILEKQGPLSPQELTFVQRHTIIGERILSAAPALNSIGVIVRGTHESFDGSGYPDGLVGTEIPIAARIIAVCDTYSAITSHRPYQVRRTHDEAVVELRAVAGTQLDPELVERFCVMVASGATEAALLPATAPA